MNIINFASSVNVIRNSKNIFLKGKMMIGFQKWINLIFSFIIEGDKRNFLLFVPKMNIFINIYIFIIYYG